MRIRIAVIVVLRVRSRALERLDAAAGDDDRGRGRGSFHQPIEPALESQPVTKTMRASATFFASAGEGA